MQHSFAATNPCHVYDMALALLVFAPWIHAGRLQQKRILEFEKQLQDLVDRIENQALESAGQEHSDLAGLKLANLLERRIGGLIAKLEEVAGRGAVQKALLEYVGTGSQTKDKKIG